MPLARGSVRRALRPGGVLSAETVNPHSIPALRTFWVDLTHLHPDLPAGCAPPCAVSTFFGANPFRRVWGTWEADRLREGESRGLIAHTPLATDDP